MNQAAAQITYRKQGPFRQLVTPLALSPALFSLFFWSCCLRWHFFKDVQPKLEIIAQTQLWPVRLQMMTESDNLRGLMHQSVKKAHLLSSATLLSPGGKSPPVMFTPAQAHRSPLSCQTLTVGFFFFFHCSVSALDHPLYQLHHSQHHTDLHCATFSIFYDTFTHLPSPPTAAKPVTCRLRGTQNHFPISRPPRLILILSISPTPIFTFLTPTHFSLLPTFSPFTSSNKSSASTQLLQIFSDPLFAISPSSSSSPSSYPFTLHRCLCLSSLYILSLRFAFSPSPAAWIYYYLHNGALLIVYELPALRPNKAYFHKKPPFHFSSN